MSKPKLFVVSDYVYATTGFGSVAYNILKYLTDKYEIHQLAINFGGDVIDNPLGIRIYHTGDHPYGFNRIEKLIEKIKPDIIFVIQDIWISDKLITKIRGIDPDVPCILYTPVDSPNIKYAFANPNNQFDHVVTYTNFAKVELERGGITKPISVIPHGIDLDSFYHVDRKVARDTLGIPDDNRFIVMYVA